MKSILAIISLATLLACGGGSSGSGSSTSPVPTGGGTGTTPTATFDLSIGKVVITQGAQNDANTVPLIENRDAVALTWVNVAPTAATSVTASVSVYNGSNSLVFTSTNNTYATPADVTSENPGNIIASTIPAAYVQRGYSYTVQINPLRTVPETSYTNNTWPSNGTFAPVIQVVKDFKVVLVPITTSLGTGVPALAMDIALIKNTLPVAKVTVTVDVPLTAPTQDVNDTTFVAKLVKALYDRRMASVDPTAYYYGVMNSVGNNIWSGIVPFGPGDPGNITVREGMGADNSNTLPHELGHMLGFSHAACNGVVQAGTDQKLHADGRTHSHYYPTTFVPNYTFYYQGPSSADLMSYCSPQAPSDNFWIAIMNARAASPIASVVQEDSSVPKV